MLPSLKKQHSLAVIERNYESSMPFPFSRVTHALGSVARDPIVVVYKYQSLLQTFSQRELAGVQPFGY